MKPGDIVDDDGNDLSTGRHKKNPKDYTFYGTSDFNRIFGDNLSGIPLDKIIEGIMGRTGYKYNQDRVPPYIEMTYSDKKMAFTFRHKLTNEEGYLTEQFLHEAHMTPQEAQRRMEQMATLGLSMDQCIRNISKSAEITNQALRGMSKHIITMGEFYSPARNPINTSRAFRAVAEEGYDMRRDEMMERLDMPFNFADVLRYVHDFINDLRKQDEHVDIANPKVQEDIADMFILLLATMFKEVEIAADETF